MLALAYDTLSARPRIAQESARRIARTCLQASRRVEETQGMRTRASSCASFPMRLQGGGRGFKSLSAHESFMATGRVLLRLRSGEHSARGAGTSRSFFAAARLGALIE